MKVVACCICYICYSDRRVRLARMRRRAAIFLSLAWIIGAVAWSCGGDDALNPLDAGGSDASFDGGTGSDGSTTDATSNDTGAGDASDASSVDRGPTRIDFSGDPAGIYWEYGLNGGLYIADQAASEIIKWTDASGFGKTWALPAPQNAGSALGQIVRELDGTMFVSRAGSGADNTVLWITSLGDAGDLSLSQDASLDPTVARQGFTLLPDNTTIDTLYALDADIDANVGMVATLKLPGTETKLVTGLSRPLAVVYNEGHLYIADGDLGEIIAFNQTGGSFLQDAGSGGGSDGGDGGGAQHGRVLAAIDQPSFACAGADGDLYVTSVTGTVYRITSAGVVTNVATGLKQLRGVAFDGAAKRLFVAEHDPATSGAQNTIRIYPID
ncbi:MAG: hypothetical protein ACRELY_12970 [Polyangiaceae bacterium]